MSNATRLATFTAVCIALLRAGAQEVVTDPVRSYGLGALRNIAALPGESFVTVGPSGAFVWSGQNETPSLRLDRPAQAYEWAVATVDGKRLVTSGPDRILRCWEVATGAQVWAVPAHRAEITGLAMSPDGRRMATCSADNTIQVRSVETGAAEREMTVPRTWLNGVAFSPDGKFLANCEGLPDERIRLWDLDNGLQVRTFAGHTNEVRAVGFLPDGRLVTAGTDKTARVWNTTTGESTSVFSGPTDPLYLLAVTGPGLVTVASQQSVFTWDPDTGHLLRKFEVGSSISALSAVPGTNHLLVATADNLVTRWDLLTGRKVASYAGHTGSTIVDVQFAPDGTQIVSGGVEGQVRLWDTFNGEQDLGLPLAPSGTSTAKFSPDGRYVLLDTGVPAPVGQLWDRATGTLVRELVGHSGWLLAGAFSADGSRLITGSTDGTARIWNTETGQLLRTLAAGAWVTAVAFSTDGEIVAAGNSNGEVSFWNAGTGALQSRRAGDAGKVVSIAFRTNLVMTAAESGLVEVRTFPDGVLVQELRPFTGYLNQAEFSPGGEMVVTAEGWPFYQATVWDLSNGASVRVLGGHTAPVESAVFSPDGRTVVTASDRLRLWVVADLVARLKLTPLADGSRLEWKTGVLQVAPSLVGPWQDLPQATSPHEVRARPGTEFYRVRVPGPF